jgi:ATP-dependent Clp protease ATP-binding subunit ClpA
MSEISRTALFGKLNPLAYKAIEGATVFCKMRGNPYVELEHWMAQLLQNPDDLQRIVQHYGLDISVLAKDVTALDRLPRGATAISDFSPHIENAIERAGSTPRCSSARRRCAPATSWWACSRQPACATRCSISQAVREGQGRGPRGPLCPDLRCLGRIEDARAGRHRHGQRRRR